MTSATPASPSRGAAGVGVGDTTAPGAGGGVAATVGVRDGSRDKTTVTAVTAAKAARPTMDHWNFVIFARATGSRYPISRGTSGAQEQQPTAAGHTARLAPCIRQGNMDDGGDAHESPGVGVS